MNTSRERTDAFAERGGHAYRKFQLACVRTGNSRILRKEMMEQSYQETLRKLFGDDYSNALLSLNFIWAQAWDTAVSAGITEKEANRIYGRWFQEANRMRTIEHLIDCHVNVLIAYAEAVKKHRDLPRFSSLVQRVCQYVEEHIYEQLQVQDISAEFQTNASYLSHLFKSETGVSLTSYIQVKKLDVAKLLLLQSDASVTEVMEQLGYISQSHFTTVFRHYTGMTPGQYKNKAKQGTLDSSLQLQQQTFVTGKENWYIQAEEYGKRQGIELQNYHLACIRRGKSEPLREYFQSPAYLENLRAMLEQNMEGAMEVFIYYWPQAAHAAADSGLEIERATKLMYSYLSKIYVCSTVFEVLDLNKNYMIDLAEAVANIK